MKMFFDSSAFAKRYVEEEGSEAVERLCCKATELGLSVICTPEIISALNRRFREGSLSRSSYQEAKTRFFTEVADAIIVHLVPAVVAEAIKLLEGNAVRALDALHVACALQWKAELFVSSNQRQLNAAKKAGLQTKQA